MLLLCGRVKRYKPLEEKVCGVNEKIGHEKVGSGCDRFGKRRRKSHSSTATLNIVYGRYLSTRMGGNLSRMSRMPKGRSRWGQLTKSSHQAAVGVDGQVTFLEGYHVGNQAAIRRILPLSALCVSRGHRRLHAEDRRSSEATWLVMPLSYMADSTRATKLKRHVGRRLGRQRHGQFDW